MSAPLHFFAAEASQSEILYIISRATVEGKVIIAILSIFSVFAWSVMASKAWQMRQAKKLNQYFDTEFRGQSNVLGIFDRRGQVEGCPLFAVYQAGCLELDTRLKTATGDGRKQFVSLKTMEHVKRTLEGAVARESLKLESGLITLAIAGRSRQMCS